MEKQIRAVRAAWPRHYKCPCPVEMSSALFINTTISQHWRSVTTISMDVGR